MGQTLANHSYVDISQVGRPDIGGGEGVQCITDLATCCTSTGGPHLGDWYFPDGSRLQFAGDGGDTFEFRTDKRVDLRRNTNANSPTGIYRCDIPTGAVHDDDDISVRDTVYVGLYTANGGTLTISSIETDQLTLTCISTGGPATTVTWTRGFTNITEGDVTTMLSEVATAMYIHTLTLTERHGGVYTCSVSNGKPSTASADITLVVEGQPNITMLHELATSISISWTSAGSEGVMYVVEWQRNTSVGCTDVDTNSTTITGGSMTSYTINGLEEDSRYVITVTASNTSGDTVSNTVTAMTGEAAPSAPPSDVEVTDVNSSSITVQWGSVPCIHQNGAITGYSVQYGVMGSGSTQMLTVNGADVTQTTIEDPHVIHYLLY
ncbi:Receptor-type tyrosine-protein phosphatase F [Geodia barretti]|nr:Receptor-type tyrosine-protein phosphatase F [Geodia barretti]